MIRSYIVSTPHVVSRIVIASGVSVLVLLLGASAVQAQGVTAGLQLWLKADAGITQSGGAVSDWADQANGVGQGGADNVTQGNASFQPQFIAGGLNGQPTVRFTNDYLSNLTETIVPLGGARTIFVVGNGDVAGHTGGTMISMTRNNYPDKMFVTQLLGSGVTPIGVYSDGVSGGSNGSIAYTAETVSPFVSAHGSAGANGTNEIQIWLNGIPRPLVSSGIIGLESGAVPGFVIGNRQDFINVADTSQSWIGDISEILVYDTLLSDTDRHTVELYLGAKYAIAVPEPVGATAALGCITAFLATRRRRRG